MALVDTTWYVNFGDGSTTGYYAIAKRPQNAAVAAGQLVRQFTTPAVGSERVFICTLAGTTANTTDATWVLTRGAATTDGTATWRECTGQAALNGDLTNTATWAQVKVATPAVVGQIIKRSNNASYQICTTAGAMSASEPAFSDTAGVSTTDTTAVWTSLGPVGNFTGGQAPFARLTNSFSSTWFQAGGTIFVGANHAETSAAAIAITTIGNAAGAIAKVLCHNQAGPYPPTSSDLTTGATIITTGSFSITFTLGGSAYVSGIMFRSQVGGANSGAVLTITTAGAAANQSWIYFKDCAFQIKSSSTGAYIQFGTTTGYNNITLNNCTVEFGSTGHSIFVAAGQFVWQNTAPAVTGSVYPIGTFFDVPGFVTHNIVLEALDLSQIASTLFSFNSLGTGAAAGTVLVKDCKINPTVSVLTPLTTGYTVNFVRSSALA